jgi:hypothetical protein
MDLKVKYFTRKLITKDLLCMLLRANMVRYSEDIPLRTGEMEKIFIMKTKRHLFFLCLTCQNIMLKRIIHFIKPLNIIIAPFQFSEVKSKTFTAS